MMSDNLKKATDELNKFLEEHPGLRWFQKEIDDALDEVEDPMDRLSILMKMVADRNNRLIDTLNEVFKS